MDSEKTIYNYMEATPVSITLPGCSFTLLAPGGPWHESSTPQAAVLLLLCFDRESPYTILTRRGESLPRHAGQISLPGGTRSAGDTNPESTALREAAEETALRSSAVEILGRLPLVTVGSGYEVVPVVAATYQAHTLVSQPGEVEEIIECPLHAMLDPGRYRPDSYIRNGIKRDFLVFDLEEYYVWGATAKILHSLASVVKS